MIQIYVDAYIKFNFCPILIKIGKCRQILEKVSQMKFHENAVSGSRFFYEQRSPVGRTGGHEVGSRCLLYECA